MRSRRARGAPIDLERACALVTLILLRCALGTPTHVLGDTAVFGRAYLWGESSSRCSVVGEAGPEIVWFVDGAEVAQHVVFGLVIAVSLAALVSGRGLRLIALSFAGLLVLDLRRAIDVDGPPVGVALPIFWVLFGWAIALCSLSIERQRRTATCCGERAGRLTPRCGEGPPGARACSPRRW